MIYHILKVEEYQFYMTAEKSLSISQLKSVFLKAMKRSEFFKIIFYIKVFTPSIIVL